MGGNNLALRSFARPGWRAGEQESGYRRLRHRNLKVTQGRVPTMAEAEILFAKIRPPTLLTLTTPPTLPTPPPPSTQPKPEPTTYPFRIFALSQIILRYNSSKIIGYSKSSYKIKVLK